MKENGWHHVYNKVVVCKTVVFVCIKIKLLMNKIKLNIILLYN